ncbi:hypothetical protein QQ056_02220 [Oscillatoria laete-virens NRMC-F 0139]|nr:hypothetical protein [Oscillatoria laete-virens NRMC-F 0139]
MQNLIPFPSLHHQYKGSWRQIHAVNISTATATGSALHTSCDRNSFTPFSHHAIDKCPVHFVAIELTIDF